MPTVNYLRVIGYEHGSTKREERLIIPILGTGGPYQQQQ